MAAFQVAKHVDDPRAGLWLVRGTIAMRTARAVLFVTAGGSRAWLPLSRVMIEDLDGDGGQVEVALPDWLAREKGLI